MFVFYYVRLIKFFYLSFMFVFFIYVYYLLSRFIYVLVNFVYEENLNYVDIVMDYFIVGKFIVFFILG